jgi:hypothetical protein
MADSIVTSLDRSIKGVVATPVSLEFSGNLPFKAWRDLEDPGAPRSVQKLRAEIQRRKEAQSPRPTTYKMRSVRFRDTREPPRRFPVTPPPGGPYYHRRASEPPDPPVVQLDDSPGGGPTCPDLLALSVEPPSVPNRVAIAKASVRALDDAEFAEFEAFFQEYRAARYGPRGRA